MTLSRGGHSTRARIITGNVGAGISNTPRFFGTIEQGAGAEQVTSSTLIPVVDLDEALRAAAVNGSYHTSRSLSKWLKRGVRLHTDGFEQVPITEVGGVAGPPDEPVAAVHMMVQGDLQGDVLLVLPEATARTLVDILLNVPAGKTQSLGEFEQSCLQETGNIVATSFCNSLSQWMGLRVVPASPMFAYDLACALIEPLVLCDAACSDAAWVARTEFELESQKLDWCMLLLLTADSLQRIRGCCESDRARQNALHALVANSAFAASRSISKWLKRGVRISTNGFERVRLGDVGHLLQSEEPVVLLHTELAHQLPAHLMLAMSVPNGHQLAELMMPGSGGQGLAFSDMASSCLVETANIVATSFANHIAKWLNLSTAPSTPQFRVDLPEAALESIVQEQALIGDDCLLSRTTFHVEGQSMECELFVLPTPQSFRMIEALCV